MKDRIFNKGQIIEELKKDVAKRARKRALFFYVFSMILSGAIGWVYGQEARDCADGWLAGGVFMVIFSILTIILYYKDKENLEHEYGLK